MSRRARGATAIALGAAVALLAGNPTAASAKQLHWKALEVDARLESDGTLAISELQRMVFSGDWNGGERNFRLEPGQQIEIERIVRIDPATGEERELRRGDLDRIDHWNWTSGKVVRWRSRLPGDPEFRATQIDYRLDYRLTGALVERGENRYLLGHDYVFADRDGVIERLVVKLTLAPEWSSLSPLPASWERSDLAPGRSFTMPVELEYRGAGIPARAAPARLPRFVRWVAVGVFLALALAFFLRFRARDGALGRFDRAGGPPVDRAWIEEHLLPLAPEVVGAAWDRTVGSAEVAALLARLTGEGKIASEVKSSGAWIFRRDDLHLKLLVDRSTFNDYERALIDGLFGADDETDTESLKKRYQSTGFNPASKIKAGLEERQKRIRGFEVGSPKPAWKPTALLLLAGLACFVVAFVAMPDKRGMIFAVLVPMTLVGLLFGLTGALEGQGRVGRMRGPAIVITLAILLLSVVIYFLAGWPGATILHLAGALLWATGWARAIFNLLATRESAESLARRRELRRARDWFERELRKPEPELEDRWFPYLLAFGLAPNVDRWFRKFGGDSGGVGSMSTARSSGGGGFAGGGGSGSGWSGGGGSFGGGGATASWALAATAMSSGVSAPSSSGGGGGGGGGSSSGGGGGGGW